MADAGVRLAGPTAAPAPRLVREAAGREAVVLGAIGFAIAVAFSWVPSIWYDEAATVSAATRDPLALARMLGEVDIVHGIFYSGMLVWFELVGSSPFALRLPSAIAAGFAVAGTVILVRRFGTRRLAIIAGLVLSVLPRFTWAGAEGRSFAIGTAIAVWSTVLLVVALEAEPPPGGRLARRRLWILYAAVTALAIAVFLYLAFMVLAHALAVAVIARGRLRSAFTHFAAAATAGVLAASPVVLIARAQSEQLSWILPIGEGTWHGVFVTQFFPFAPAAAAVGWTLAAAGAAIALLARGRRDPRLVAVALPWLVLPVLGVIGASLVLTPLYSPRYLTFALPAFAILVAIALDALLAVRSTRVVALAAAAALVATIAPAYVTQRTPEAKQGSTWSQAAEIVQRESAAAGGRQAVVFGPVRKHPGTTARVIATTYPEAFRGLEDPTLGPPPTGLWPRNLALEADDLRGVDAVWLVTTNIAEDPKKRAVLEDAGFTAQREWDLDWVRLVRFDRADLRTG